MKSDNVIQLFSEVRYLNKSSTDKLEFSSIPDLLRSSAGSELSTGEFKDVCLVRAESVGARKAVWPANGFALAAKKSIIREIKLYDHGVLDGNDILFLCAIYGEFEVAMERLKHNHMQRRHYLQWARHAHETARRAAVRAGVAVAELRRIRAHQVIVTQRVRDRDADPAEASP